jgi:hypothetical protein
MLSKNILAVAERRRPEICHDHGRKITARSIKTDFELHGTVKNDLYAALLSFNESSSTPCFFDVIEQQVERSMSARSTMKNGGKTPRQVAY